VTKLKYDSKAVARTIKNSKDIFMYSYHKIGELKYILKVNIKTATENKLIMGIETLLNIISIILQDKWKKRLSIILAFKKGKML